MRLEHARPRRSPTLLAKLKRRRARCRVFAPPARWCSSIARANVRRMEELGARSTSARRTSRNRLHAADARAGARPSWRRRSRRCLPALADAPRRARDAKARARPRPPAARRRRDRARAARRGAPGGGGRQRGRLCARAGARRRASIRPADDGAAAQAHVIYLANTNAEDMAATLQRSGSAADAARAAAGAPADAAARPAGRARCRCRARCASAPTRSPTRSWCSPARATSRWCAIWCSKLDVPRRQVYVEAIILDLTVDKSAHHRRLVAPGVGQRRRQRHRRGRQRVVDAGEHARASAAADGSAARIGGGLFAGVLGKSFSVVGQSIPRFGVACRALEHTKDVNIISRPHLLTMDNTKAEHLRRAADSPIRRVARLARTGTTPPSCSTATRASRWRSSSS